jgi:hypothetical protein
VSRPKKMLPVLGQAPQEPEGQKPGPALGEADGCCSDNATVEKASAATPRTREANPEMPSGVPPARAPHGD